MTLREAIQSIHYNHNSFIFETEFFETEFFEALKDLIDTRGLVSSKGRIIMEGLNPSNNTEFERMSVYLDTNRNEALPQCVNLPGYKIGEVDPLDFEQEKFRLKMGEL